MENLIRIAIIAAACVFAEPQLLLGQDVDIEAMKRSLEAQIGLYQRVNDLEQRVTNLEQKGGDPTTASETVAPSPGSAAAPPKDAVADLSIELDPAVVAAARGPTPREDIGKIMQLFDLDPGRTLVDLGSGDGRILIGAAYHGLKVGGVENDPEQVAKSQQAIDALGLGAEAKVYEGDVLTTDIDADGAYVYLYPETLAKLADRLKEYSVVVSRMHPVPGLTMTQHGDYFVYRKPRMQTVTQYQQVQEYVAPWSPRGFNCGNPRCVMCNGGYRTVTKPVQVQAAVQRPAYQQSACARGNCANGNCRR